MNIGESLLNALKDAGAKALFGIPGDYILPFFDIIEETNILPLYTFSHEPAVGYAADAAARYGGGVGVAVVTYGAGALNMLNTVACAWAEHSPLVIISGAPGKVEFDRGLLLHHQLKDAQSQMRIFEEVTCARAILNDPKNAPDEIARVLKACREHSRPVYIELPRNMPQVTCLPVPKYETEKNNAETVKECAERIKNLIGESKRPAILAGIEIRRFGLETLVAKLSARTHIPLATTLMGKGLFAGHKPCLGTYMGSVGDADICDAIENSDCLLMIGTITSDTNLGASGIDINLKKSILINNGSIIIAGEEFEGISISDFLHTLDKMIPSTQITHTHIKNNTSPKPSISKNKGILCADDIAMVVNTHFSNNVKMPIAVDVGDCLFIATEIHDVPLLASGYYATMGFGVPAGLGIQAITNDRPLIIVGDGGFQMTGWELVNCARNGFDPIVLVLNNNGWGMLKQFHPNAGYTDCASMSYAAMAETLGGNGHRVTTPKELASALQKATLQRGKFQLIEAILPKSDISSLLKNYVTVLKAKTAAQKINQMSTHLKGNSLK